jgi:putative transposase
VESFFASLKRELVHDERYTTRGEAQVSIFGYVEAFYNRVRLVAEVCVPGRVRAGT